jgi:hypothetical protein
LQDGIVKELETVGLVGALLLSIAAQVLFSVPETISSITGHLSVLRNVYLLCGAFAFGCEAMAVCFSVLLILMLNAQQTDDAYTDLVLFLKGFWTVCGLTPILAAAGLWAVSGAMVLYCCAGYITGSITLAVPIIVGVACVAAYVLTFAILLKVLLRSLKPVKKHSLATAAA